MLRKLYLRDKTQVKSKAICNEVLVLKTQYAQCLKRLRLKKEIAHLLSALRSVLGQSFLEGVKVFIAHPVTSNVFLRTYKYNFPPPWKLSAPDAGVRAEERENLS